MPDIALMVITDGRMYCLERTLASLDEMVTAPWTRKLLVNDSLDVAYMQAVEDLCPDFEFYHSVLDGGKKGFGGAIQAGWQRLAYCGERPRFVFHLEDDFTFNRPVDVRRMAGILAARPHLVQIALLRQPVNADEVRAGGLLAMWPDAYREVREYGTARLEHRLFFTTNPSLYRAELMLDGWPEGSGSERAFTQRVLATTPNAKFAYWGTRDDGPWVTHIGDTRVGTGY